MPGMAAPLPSQPVHLVAIDPVRNIRRWYTVSVERDLFGSFIVRTGWGRIGRSGRIAVRSFVSEGEAAGFVQAVLKRRSTAKRRIGVPYLPSPNQK